MQHRCITTEFVPLPLLVHQSETDGRLLLHTAQAIFEIAPAVLFQVVSVGEVPGVQFLLLSVRVLL